MTIFKSALRRGFFAPFALIFNCALPLALMVAMRGEGLGEQGLFLIALAFMFGGYFMSKGVQNDRSEGVLWRILCGPVTMGEYLFYNLLSAAVPMLGLSAIIGALGIVLHEWTLTFALGLALSYALLAITSIGLSFLWSSLFKSKEAKSGAFAAVMTFVAALCGFFVPLARMPDVLYYAGMIFPAHWASRGIQVMLDYGAFTGMFWLCMLVMALFTALFIFIGGRRRLI